MNNLKILKYNESILKNAKLITNGSSFFKTYDLNNGKIMKVVKSVDECYDGTNAMFLYTSYNEFIDNIYKKLYKSKDIKTSSIVLPNAIYLDKDIPRAYTVPKLKNSIGLNEYLKKNNDLDSIANIIIKMIEEVKKANKENIIFPDLGNTTNTLINPKTKDIKFIDYDGLQIDNYTSFCISSLINDIVEPHTSSLKYYNLKTGLATSNLDKFTIYAIFLYFTTHTFTSSFGPHNYHFVDGKLELKESAFLDYTKSIGVEDTPFEEDLFDVFYSENLKFPTTSIKKLIKTHSLEKQGDKRVFVRKKYDILK